MEVSIKGEPKEIAALLLEVAGRQEVDQQINSSVHVDENTVMGITSKAFGAAVGVMHDLTGHFHGDRYTMVIEVEPDGVLVKKIPKG
jgi:hypothetical protein